jgi:hypothetical protein
VTECGQTSCQRAADLPGADDSYVHVGTPLSRKVVNGVGLANTLDIRAGGNVYAGSLPIKFYEKFALGVTAGWHVFKYEHAVVNRERRRNDRRLL